MAMMLDTVGTILRILETVAVATGVVPVADVRPLLMNAGVNTQTKVEKLGIDPSASRMLSERSTI